MRPLVVLAALLALTACGKQGNLRPVAPRTMPQQPTDAIRPLTPEDMLKLPPQAIPSRVDDPLSRSQERPDDRFNLPPPR